MKNLLILFLALFLLVLIGVFVPPYASAASLYFSPSSGVYEKGSTLKVNIYTNTAGESVNAVQANFNYPTDKLQFSSISTSGSVLSIIAEKNGGGGAVRIAGGNPTPFSGTKFIASVYFKVLVSSGTATLSFSADSAVVRVSDNQSVLKSYSSATFSFSEKSAEPTPTEGQKKPPEISEVKVENLGKNTATITWVTDLDSTSVVEFGLTPSLGLLASSDELVKEHKVDLPQGLLLPGTKYFFKVVSRIEELEGVSEGHFFTTFGYKVFLKITTKSEKPASGAVVTLYSETKSGTTDSGGKIEFTDISPGKHLVVVKYKGTIENKEINVQDEDIQSFDIKLSSDGLKISGLSLLVLVLFILLVLLTAVATFYLRFKKRHKNLDNINLADNFNQESAYDKDKPTGNI